jgi:putative tricarboxylic transport membrane protein
MFKGIVSFLLGALFSIVGMDKSTITSRLTFGSLNLMIGIELIPVAVGLMGLSEIILSIAEDEFIEIKKDGFNLKIKNIFPNLKEIVFCLPTIIRSMFLGFFVGVLPGAGVSIASMLAYKTEERIASDRKNFGKGSLQGVAAPEAANNACVSGAMVPMLSLGIPGSGGTALLLGALIMVGIQPGPGLITRNPEIFWGLISSMYIGNIMLVIMCFALIPVFLWVLKVSQKTLPVVVGILCIVGTYGSQYSLFDVGLMLFFTVIGLFFKTLKLPVAPLLIAIVLGPDLEKTFRQTMTLFNNDLWNFSGRPISLVLIALIVVMIIFPIIGFIKKRK